MTDMRATKRAVRIQSPSIDLPFRTPDGAIIVADVYREDILEWHPDERFPPQWFLVIDFGVEQRLVTDATDAEQVYDDTGRVQLDLQPLDIASVDEWDPDTTVGLGPPVARFADVPTEELGDVPTGEPRVGRPMVGWIRHSVSTRRGG